MSPPEVPVWATFYDIRRYGGLQIFLRAVVAGARLLLSEGDETLGDFIARCGEAGVTRGTNAVALPDPWLIDVTRSGNVCLKENAQPVFWRPDAKTAVSLLVMPVDRSWKSQANWPAGMDRVQVTTDVPMHGGAAYVVNYAGSEYALAVSMVPASLANDRMRAAWMAQKGCAAQAEALLRPRK